MKFWDIGGFSRKGFNSKAFVFNIRCFLFLIIDKNYNLEIDSKCVFGKKNFNLFLR